MDTRRLAKWTWLSPGLLFFVLSTHFVPFCKLASLLCSSIHVPGNQVNSSSAVQRGCIKQCYTRLNHECTQQDSTYLCKDQLCTQRFKFKLNKGTQMPSHKDDSIFTRNGSTLYSSGITYNSHVHKDEHIHDLTHRFARIFQSTFVQFTQDQEGLFKACNGA
ncbi:hypothetical protein H5410_015539 [Solanum commersonii]|uniref:Uncharacterized protein n=1 Tax=Solanum commersonii TaxID=4109 RepID=A0A9J5ZUE6_SOLCO|nr:hypothetical protein H5410_015539 [Solanum commersonii]